MVAPSGRGRPSRTGRRRPSPPPPSCSLGHGQRAAGAGRAEEPPSQTALAAPRSQIAGLSNTGQACPRLRGPLHCVQRYNRPIPEPGRSRAAPVRPSAYRRARKPTELDGSRTLSAEILAATGINAATLLPVRQVLRRLPHGRRVATCARTTSCASSSGPPRRGAARRVDLALPHLRDLLGPLPQRLRPGARHRRRARDEPRGRRRRPSRAASPPSTARSSRRSAANGRLHEIGHGHGVQAAQRRPHEGRHQRPRACSRRGKLSLRADRIEGVDEIKRIFDEVRGDAVSGTATTARPPRRRRLLPRLLAARHLARVRREPARRGRPRWASSITEIDDWSCCGASSGHTTDHLLGVALPARNLALAEAQGFDSVLAPCAACYNRLAAARLAVATEEGLAERMPDILGRPFANTVEVHNVVELLRDAAAAHRGEGGRDAARPTRSRASSSPPTTAACSCAPPRSAATTTPSSPPPWTRSSPPAAPTPVEWNMKVECCGGALQRQPHRLGRAPRAGDHRRRPRPRRRGHRRRLPAVPQQPRPPPEGDGRARRGADADALRHAAGRPRRRPAGRPLGLERHFVDTEPLLARLAKQAVEREAAEQKVKEEAAAKAAARAAKQKAAAAEPGAGDAAGR